MPMPRSHPARSREIASNTARRDSSRRLYSYDPVTPFWLLHAVRMRPMRFPRPKSLSGLMLIGFTIVAAPLLFAIVNAAFQMNSLSVRSQQLVAHGMKGPPNNHPMPAEIEALERQAPLYQATGTAAFRDVYARHHDRLGTA